MRIWSDNLFHETLMRFYSKHRHAVTSMMFYDGFYGVTNFASQAVGLHFEAMSKPERIAANTKEPSGNHIKWTLRLLLFLQILSVGFALSSRIEKKRISCLRILTNRFEFQTLECSVPFLNFETQLRIQTRKEELSKIFCTNDRLTVFKFTNLKSWSLFQDSFKMLKTALWAMWNSVIYFHWCK